MPNSKKIREKIKGTTGGKKRIIFFGLQKRITDSEFDKKM